LAGPSRLIAAKNLDSDAYKAAQNFCSKRHEGRKREESGRQSRGERKTAIKAKREEKGMNADTLT
jgi:hypothetical protein